MRRRARVIILGSVFAMVFATTAMALALDSSWSNWNTPNVKSQANLTEQDIYAAPGDRGGNLDCNSQYSAKVDAEDIDAGDIYDLGAGSVEVTYFDGKTLNWKIADGSEDDIDVAQVIVKGGPAARVHTYNTNQADYGWDLRAPVNPNNGKNYGISNVSFCFDDKS